MRMWPLCGALELSNPSGRGLIACLVQIKPHKAIYGIALEVLRREDEPVKRCCRSKTSFGQDHGCAFQGGCNYGWKKNASDPEGLVWVNTETRYKRPPGIFS